MWLVPDNVASPPIQPRYCRTSRPFDWRYDCYVWQGSMHRASIVIMLEGIQMQLLTEILQSLLSRFSSESVWDTRHIMTYTDTQGQLDYHEQSVIDPLRASSSPIWTVVSTFQLAMLCPYACSCMATQKYGFAASIHRGVAVVSEVLMVTMKQRWNALSLPNSRQKVWNL